MGHVVMENRNGLVVVTTVTPATGIGTKTYAKPESHFPSPDRRSPLYSLNCERLTNYTVDDARLEL
jgi:hypothetical protein